MRRDERQVIVERPSGMILRHPVREGDERAVCRVLRRLTEAVDLRDGTWWVQPGSDR